MATFALAPLLALDWLLLSQGVCRSRVGGEEESEGAGDGGCSVSNNLLSPATSQQNPLMLVNGEDAYTALYHTHNSHTCSTGPPTRTPTCTYPETRCRDPLRALNCALRFLLYPHALSPTESSPRSPISGLVTPLAPPPFPHKDPSDSSDPLPFSLSLPAAPSPCPPPQTLPIPSTLAPPQ